MNISNRAPDWHVDLPSNNTLGFKQLPDGSDSRGTASPRESRKGEQEAIVATTINLMPGNVADASAASAVRPAVSDDAVMLAHEASNEAREGLGHLVGKRHHAP
jgi:hypothetical protein